MSQQVTLELNPKGHQELIGMLLSTPEAMGVLDSIVANEPFSEVANPRGSHDLTLEIFEKFGVIKRDSTTVNGYKAIYQLLAFSSGVVTQSRIAAATALVSEVIAKSITDSDSVEDLVISNKHARTTRAIADEYVRDLQKAKDKLVASSLKAAAAGQREDTLLRVAIVAKLSNLKKN